MPTKTENVYLSGKCKWCKSQEPNQFGDYKVDLFPDSESLNKLMELKARGLKNVLKNTEDGPSMSFKRPTRKTMRNQVINFGPPVVVDKEGSPTLQAVGNGSDVTIKLLIYPYKVPGIGTPGIGARWESLRIDNLVPFSNQQFTVEQERAASGLMDQPVPNYNF